jgi:hypothetical protein
MATIKEATQNARSFAADTLGEARIQGLRLEEVESGREDGNEVWRITLSMVLPKDDSPHLGIGAALGGLATPPRRVYKTFRVEKRTGEVTSMKMRELSNV